MLAPRERRTGALDNARIPGGERVVIYGWQRARSAQKLVGPVVKILQAGKALPLSHASDKSAHADATMPTCAQLTSHVVGRVGSCIKVAIAWPPITVLDDRSVGARAGPAAVGSRVGAVREGMWHRASTALRLVPKDCVQDYNVNITTSSPVTGAPNSLSGICPTHLEGCAVDILLATRAALGGCNRQGAQGWSSR